MESVYGISSSTVVCVRLLGPLEVSRRVQDGSWQTVDRKVWGQGTPPRSVFKRLLTTSNRRLSRLDIQEDLWPDASMELADRYLNSAVTVIRQIIGKPLLETIGPLYALVDQSQVWTDLDACKLLLREAENAGCTMPEALPFLEEAHRYFERGTALEDEAERWCHAIRADSERARRQVRLWLAGGYERVEKLWQAGEVYQAMCAVPGDEEALQRWIELLARHGKTKEAVACYQEARTEWERQGVVLSRAFEQTIAALERPEDMNRREITKKLVGGLLFASHQLSSPVCAGDFLRNEEIFSICAANIPILWRLYFDGRFAEVQQTLPEYLTRLSPLTQNPHYQKSAANLLSQASQLAALMEKHLYNSGNALLYAQQGEYYGQLAGNPNVQMAALIQQANIYLDLGQAWRELQAYQRAYSLYQRAKRNNDISPLLLGRIYIGLAKSYGKFGDYKDRALRLLEMAHRFYPEHPEGDAAFCYSYHTRFTLLNHTGLTYLNIGQPEQALDVFEALTVPIALVPRRLEFLIRLSMTFFALGDLEQACEQTGFAATSARKLGSDLRYHEAYTIYEQIRGRWPQEVRVKKLAEHFR